MKPPQNNVVQRESTFDQVSRRFRSLDPAYMEELAKRATQQFGAQALQPSQSLLPPTMGPSMDEQPYSGPEGMGLRLVRGLFNVATSSSRPPSEIDEEIRRVLTANNVAFRTERHMFQCHWQREDKGVIFTIEICRIDTLPLFGLHLNRISGEPWVYKTLCDELTLQMRL
jgi:hypothetical protein